MSAYIISRQKCGCLARGYHGHQHLLLCECTGATGRSLAGGCIATVGTWQLGITTLVLLIVAEVALHIVLTIGAGRAAAEAKRDGYKEHKK